MKLRLLAFAVLCALGARVWWRAETEAPLGAPETELVVPAGASLLAISEQLASAGLIKRPWTFALLVRFRGDDARMKAGRYRFSGPFSMLDIERKIAEGDVERRQVTFPEGRNLFEMAEIAGKAGLSSEGFLAAAKEPSSIADIDPDAKTLEGYLFPETYEIKDGSSERALVQEMTRVAREVFEELGLTSAGGVVSGLPLTLRQIVTLASIVELETAAPEERPRIAAVFLNRLKIGMPLQTDPTVIYALKLEGRYDGNIRKVDLSSDSAYNTYRFPGLPPGPIGSAGRSAIKAVLGPEATDALYFVSRNDGTHVFSKTLSDHERAVDQYQRRRSAPAVQTPSPKTKPGK
jgi:UPF0755 protein